MSLDASTAIKVPSRGPTTPGALPALTIAAHPDPARVGDRAVLGELSAGREVELSRQTLEFQRPGSPGGAPLGDPFVSRTPIRLVPATDGRIRLVRGDSTTTIEIAGLDHDTVELGPLTAGQGIPIALADRLVVVLHLIDAEDAGGLALGDDLGMVGAGSAIRRVREAITEIVDLTVPVLIRGETGTGKELVARALHDGSPRRAGPFVSVNLAAIGKELAAAELFGAVRGAYTGAVGDREGYFRAAAGGTLFLDEIGEAPAEVQAMLLRVVETGELYPVGGQRPIATDVRLIAATDARLEAQIEAGTFKAPLLHRLAGHEIHLPALRERPEDIGPLIHHVAREELTALGELDKLVARDGDGDPWLPPAIAGALVRFRWPGNVRQLRNVTRQIVIHSRGRAQLVLPPRLARELEAGARSLPVARLTTIATAPPASAVEPGKRRRPADVTEPELLAALRARGWDVKAAADQLDIPRSSIYAIMDRCPNIRTARDLTPDEITQAHRDSAGDLDRMAAALEVSRRALQRRVKDLGLEIRSADA